MRVWQTMAWRTALAALALLGLAASAAARTQPARGFNGMEIAEAIGRTGRGSLTVHYNQKTQIGRTL